MWGAGGGTIPTRRTRRPESRFCDAALLSTCPFPTPLSRPRRALGVRRARTRSGIGGAAGWRRVCTQKRKQLAHGGGRSPRALFGPPAASPPLSRSHTACNPFPHTASPFPQVNTPAEEEPDCFFADDAVDLQTPPHDPRFPSTNQSRNCFTQYNMYHKCVAGADGDADAEACDKYRKAYRSLCPGEWVAKWNEQRDAGSWPGKY